MLQLARLCCPGKARRHTDTQDGSEEVQDAAPPQIKTENGGKKIWGRSIPSD